ncbi:hypothetical protein BSKO_10583 [Bryopsis sp. KO-2023]|nr:hypothetical protein BSKO_10583 [Bryopsis sp. KO-2023]
MAQEEFEDFSFASPWERFSGAVEQVLRSWCRPGGEKSTAERDVATEVELKHKLPFRKDAYLLKLYLKGAANREEPDTDHQDSIDDAGEIPPPSSTVSRSSGEGSDVASLSDESLTEQDLPSDSQASGAGGSSGATTTTEQPSILKRESINASRFSGGVFSSAVTHFDDSLHKIQRWFGVGTFALLRPGSYTGRILDSQEATTVLSAISLALSNTPNPLPVFIPVHDNFRDGYWGVAVIDGKTVHFDVDSSQATRRPDGVRQVSGQLAVLSEQLAGYSPEASNLCQALAQAHGPETDVDMDAGNVTEAGGYEVTVSACVAYRVPVPGTPPELEASDAASYWRDTWDEGCVWQPWAVEVDPIEALELDLIWKEAPLTLLQGTPKLTASNADQWRLQVLAAERSPNVTWSIFSQKRSFDRQHLRLPRLKNVMEGREWGVGGYTGDKRTLSVRLRGLLDGLEWVESARVVGDLGDALWWDVRTESLPVVPPEEVLMQSIKDLFGEGEDLKPGFMTDHVHYADLNREFEKACALSSMAPFDSLFCRLALHAVVYKNPRAVSLLWGHFVHAIRRKHWEPLNLLPFMADGGMDSLAEPPVPDLNACLAHQKLQLINVCIHRRKIQEKGGYVSSAISKLSGQPSHRDTAGSVESEYESCNDGEEPFQSMDISHRISSGEASELYSAGGGIEEELGPSTVGQRVGDIQQDGGSNEGVASVLEECLLLHPSVPVNVPSTQPIPVYTADTLAQQQSMLSALEESPEGQRRASKIQTRVLMSDMAAFKAANHGCALEDFVRWHSPKDWIKDEKGSGKLSLRMSQANNRWKQHWQEVEPCPAARQIPLMDPLVEGERAMHYLETIPPSELFHQMIHVGFLGMLGCLQRSQSAELPPIRNALIEFQKHVERWDPDEMSLRKSSALLDGFELLERVVVLGEAVAKRLRGCPKASLSILEMLVGSDAGQECMDERKGVDVSDDEKPMVSAIMRQGKRGTSTANWAPALEHEWMISCRKGEGEGVVGHRLFVKDAVGELRIGTVLTAED